MPVSASVRRLIWVDVVRGTAILLMIIFHFCYDLRYFGYVDWQVPNGPNWWPFRYLILTLFIFTIGVSLSLAHAKGFRRKPFFIRLGQLSISALAITVMSLIVFPNAWIYFGILHFIALASLLGILLVPYPRFSLLLGAVFLVGFWLDILKNNWPFNFFDTWLPAYTEDFVPLIPWLGVMYLGIALAGLAPLHKGDLPVNRMTSPLAAVGRHGLLIYLVHQPLLFAGFIALGFVNRL